MLKDVLAMIGGSSIVVIFWLLICLLCTALREWIHNLRIKYTIKRRFSKPPTAKCYCRDCKRHNNESGACYKFKGWLTADSWFCWDAVPRTDKGVLEEDNNNAD